MLAKKKPYTRKASAMARFGLLLAILLITAAVFYNLHGLQIDNTETALDSNQKETLGYWKHLVKRIGFRPEGMEDLDEVLLVEGCLLLDKQQVKSEFMQLHKLPRQKVPVTPTHFHTRHLVDRQKARNITVRVDGNVPKQGSDDWRRAVKKAISEWNTVPFSILRFIYTEGPEADITIAADEGRLGNTTLAVAGFPYDGKPFHTILINLDYQNNRRITHEVKQYNIVHELGHCIGFRHTNWMERNESPGTFGAIKLLDTPSSGGASIMEGGTAEKSWMGFSDWDIAATRMLYWSDLAMANGCNHKH